MTLKGRRETDMAERIPKLSVIIPVYNDEANMVRRLRNAAEAFAEDADSKAIITDALKSHWNYDNRLASRKYGEINNFYSVIPEWDTILHTLNGFLCGAVGFSLVDLLNRNIKSINLSPIFILIVSFSFSMTIGVLWEFFEYSADKSFLQTDMQKDRILNKVSSVKINPSGENKPIIIENIDHTIIYSKDKKGNTIETKIDNGYLDIGLNDTMKDLGVNFIGAIVFSIFGYLYILNRDKYHFIDHFILRSKQ